jgi:GNAT superfamily N-acetyltransferase
VQTTEIALDFPAELDQKSTRKNRSIIPESLAHRTAAASLLLRHGDVGLLTQLGWETFFGVAHMVLLKLDLASFRSEHLCRYSLAARPVEPGDHPFFFDLSKQEYTGRERIDAARRLFTLNAGIKTCYVVQDSSGNPRFLQWLIPSSENTQLHQVYGDWYPEIGPDEAMIEHAYVLPEYRGNGLLPCAVAQVLKIARESGARRVVTCIPTWNENSLKSFKRMGFVPFVRRTDRKFFGIRYRRFYW